MNKQCMPLEVKKSRNHNQKLLAIAEAFEPMDWDEFYKNGVSTCANIKYQIEDGVKWEDCFAAQVSAPYVLARLCALFNGLVIRSQGQEGYKTTWDIMLKHKETGHVVTFYDYKGGISFGSDVYGDKAPASLVRDLKKLIKTLSDERVPHPYDGCIVGEIA